MDDNWNALSIQIFNMQPQALEIILDIYRQFA